MSDSILDKALGLFSSVQDARTEGRNDLMRAILPEILQLEELKQAEAKPMKEEASKTLHAPKYDRRMKFDTALERSGHKATSEEPVQAKEDPAWLKEAVEKIAISEGLAIRALTRATEGATDAASAFKAINKYPRINLRAQGVADPAIRREALPHFKEYTEAASQLTNPATLTPEMSEGVFSRLFSSQNRLGEILGKQASDPAFDFAGVTGREGVITVEDELERTPPLPLEEPMWYDVANKPVMQKNALYPDDTETFTQRHPWVLPAGIGLLGAAAGAVPAGLLGGRHAIKAVQKIHDLRRGVLEREIAEAVQKSRNANKNWNLSKREFDDLKKMVPKKREALKNLEAPNYGMHETLGRIGGGTLGGLTGGSLGVLGGLAANKPQPWEQ